MKDSSPKPVLVTLAALAVLGALGGAAVVGFGLYNVSAREGHVPGVSGVLHTTFKQSVRLRAPAAAEVPDDLGDPDRIELGALHFQSACAFCHAVPGQPRSATALSMSPQPPHITEAVSQWEPRHMFWIVREGVKMSGMPHWPAEGRDDEIWSIVAYLAALRDLSANDQVALTGEGQAEPSCTACHGEGGQSTNAFVPRLDLLTPNQIADALTAYRDGTRASGIMQHAAAPLSDDAITGLAREFGTDQSAAPVASSGDTPAHPLATQGSRDVPACTACHGPRRRADGPIAPVLAGQSQAYLVSQLRLWRDGTRGGGPRSELMEKAAQGLNDAEIDDLAAWFSGLESDATPQD